MIRALLLAALFAPGAPASERILVLDGPEPFVVPVEMNGATLRLRVDPAASGLVLLNPDAARRAGIEPDRLRTPPGFPGLRYRKAWARIGPVRIEGHSGRTKATIGGVAVPLQAIWFDRDAVKDADGVISVHHLPYDEVRFALAPPAEAESETAIPLDYAPELGLHHRYAPRGEAVAIQLSVHRPASLATAAAGAVIAEHHDGAWAGEGERRPVSFGIARPVRPMALGAPLLIEDLAVERFLVRTRDHRGDFDLPSDGPPDPEEIVVTGAVKGQPPRLTLVLGRDQLAGCSGLAYRRAERRLVVRCAPAAEPGE